MVLFPLRVDTVIIYYILYGNNIVGVWKYLVYYKEAVLK